MCVQAGVRSPFDRLATEYDELKLRVIPGYREEAGLDAERIPHVLEDHRENDLAEAAATQVSYLRAAGFAPAEMIWSWEKLALFYAAKPGAPVTLREPNSPEGDG